ncbi:MAG TPA: extracellular solute-binding protein [Gaiellaceae bacterium]|jgi:ABC-type glycerol-3-phosphate transport system substrate-binding protein
MTRKRIALVGIAAALALLVAGSAGANIRSHSSRSAVSGSITFDGIWTASSGQKQFADVIKAFNKKFPDVKVNYKPVGNDLPTVLATAVAGGHPPDMADIAQPGTVSQLATQGKLKPITYARGTMAANFAPAWLALGTYSGKLYALPFKAANKSVVWYNVPAFKNAGVNPPKTFNQLLTDAKTIKASGTPAYSIGGADGWTLTDMFENIYLRTFGAAKYNALSQHKIKWTDASVKTALTSMAKIVGDTGNIAGGSSGALQYGFNDSVTNAFAQPPKAAMVFEADFVGGVITSSTKAKPATGFNTFAWPAITPGANASSVEIGGDLFVTFRDTPAIRAFVNFLATPTAAIAWAKQGGFGTGNKHVAASIYPDPITRATEAPIGQAKQVVFDMSDQQPPSFGATTGQGEWGLFQDFLKNPKDVAGIQKKLESAAAAAYKKGK